jgi:cation diffusion facilitator family transporter
LGRTGYIAAASIAVGIIVLGLKGLAWWLTGSAALYSDALESVVNVAASGIAYWALTVAAKPADENHPYGHEKAEFFAAVIEGALIVIAAMLILQHAWNVWQNPRPLDTPFIGLAVNGAATVLNLIWGTVLVRAGRRVRSPALAADGRHLLADVITSAGVIAGVAISVTTGYLRIDPLLAAATAAYILLSGMWMIRDSVGGLMDAAPEPRVIERIRELVSIHAAGAIEAHDLRTRHAGRVTHLQFHLVVPGDMTVSDAHAICDRIEDALKRDMEGLVITIHVEPEGKAKHHGVLVL